LLAGKDKANPIAAILAGAMMLDRLGEKAGGEQIVTAVETVCQEKRVWIDSDGCPIEGTKSVVEAVVRQIEEVGESGQ